MKNTIGKAVSLAFGLAALGKEQVEKVVGELEKQGEMSKNEANEWISAVVEKGKETEAAMDKLIKERFQALLKEQGLATQEEVNALKQRIEALEQAQQHQPEQQ